MPSDITGEQLLSWVLRAVPYTFGVLVIIWLLMGAILDYHWRRYGIGILHVFKVRVAYLACGIIFIGIMAVAVISL